MLARRRDSLVLAALAVLSYALAFLQRPGDAVTDTKIDLHVDPVSFLADAAAPWSSDISLGHVQSGQYGGYVFPMGPFFALWRELGVSPWVTERLWLGTVLAVAAIGVVWLLDALKGRPRGVVHVVAALVFLLNPYVVTYASRVSVSLLGYAALPFLLLIVHRGLRARRRNGPDQEDRAGTGWLWPAAFALVVTSSGGGINAAVTAWVLVGPLLLLLYEPLAGGVAWRAVWRFVWRTALLGAVTSLWWVVPLLVQSKYGLPFLPYTEQAGTIWNTTSATESLRLMGFWLSYVGTGYGGRLTPYMTDAGTLLFWVPALIASLLVPAAALGGFAWTRRWRYAPFFLLLTLLGVIVMIAGFPEGTPLRRGMTFAYNHLVSLQFLRTTYKAGPLVALGLAVLGGAAAEVLWARLRAVERPAGRRVAQTAMAVGVLAAVALAAWPIVRGVGLEQKLAWKAIPAAWTGVAADLDRDQGDDERAMVLPGQLFSAYRWGGTVDPILPTLTEKPVAVRQVVPFADLRSVDLQWATDALVSQRRQLPEQLRRLLAFQSVGQVIQGTDDDRGRSGALGPNEAAQELALSGLGAPTAAYGPVEAVPAQAGNVAPPAVLPQARRWTAEAAPLVQLLPRDRATIVDGSSGGVLGLAAFGPLPAGQPVRYAADLEPEALRDLASTGSEVAISDSNRRRVFVPSRLRGNQGATLAPGDPISEDGHQLDPWPLLGTDVQTVARLDGVRYVRAPFSPQVTQFPEHRPYAAMDGDPGTAWLADRALAEDRWYLDVGLDHRQDVPYVDLLPYSDARGTTKAVTVNGKRFAVHPGWNRLPVGLKDTGVVQVGMAEVTRPPGVSSGAGGIRELKIPGVTVHEALRVPVDAENALRTADLEQTPLKYLFERTRGDDPFHRDTVHGPWQAGEVRDQGDAETGMERIVSPPAARGWTARAWLTVSPAASDSRLDRWAGGWLPARYDSSGRFQNQPRWRASSAFDGRAATAWIAPWLGEGSRARLTWTAPAAHTLRTLTLVPPVQRVRVPTRVRVTVDGKRTGALPVAADGTVTLPAPLTGRAVTLDVLDAAFPAGTGGVRAQRRAVGVGEVRGTGLAPAAPRRSGPLRTGASGSSASSCDVTVSAGTARLGLRLDDTVQALDAGRPLRGVPCGPDGGRTALPKGELLVSVPGDGPLRVDALQLASPAPVAAAPTVPAGTVTSTGTPGRGTRRDIGLDVTRPGWIVLGQSYSTGWTATCDGRDLGAPVPMQVYAVGWPVEPGCRTVDVVFAGNRPVALAFWISLVASLGLLALVAVGLWRRRRYGAAEQVDEGALVLPDLAPVRTSLRTALLWAVAATLVGAFVFALRAGPFVGLATFVVLWRGIGAKPLSIAAGLLLAVVVPFLSLVIPVKDHGGYDTSYPIERIATHWVSVAAIVLLLLALYRALAAGVRGVRALRARTPSTSIPTAARH